MLQALIDALNHAVEVGVKTGLEKLYADSLHKIILPANERVLREIFIQLTYTFAAGTKECEYLVENNAILCLITIAISL